MLKYHIGCGKRYFGPDWVHVDGADYDHINSHDYILRDVPKNSVDVIYASHFIEYFDREEALPLLGIWQQRLKPGGILRLAVPDWDNMVLAVTQNGFKLKDILGPLYGRMEMNGQLIYHKTVYDYDDLIGILIEAGFKEARGYDWRQTEHAEFDDQSQAYLPKMAKDTGLLISLNVEATK